MQQELLETGFIAERVNPSVNCISPTLVHSTSAASSSTSQTPWNAPNRECVSNEPLIPSSLSNSGNSFSVLGGDWSSGDFFVPLDHMACKTISIKASESIQLPSMHKNWQSNGWDARCRLEGAHYKQSGALLLAKAKKEAAATNEEVAICTLNETRLLVRALDIEKEGRSLGITDALELTRATRNTLSAIYKAALIEARIGAIQYKKAMDRTEEARAHLREAEEQVSTLIYYTSHTDSPPQPTPFSQVVAELERNPL